MRRAILAVAALAPLASGCGAYVRSTATVPATTTSTIPTSPTVPAFGAPASVEPATAADAMGNASGACGVFDILYIKAAQAFVPATVAQPSVLQANSFAAAAAAGAPSQWMQLHTDLEALSGVVATPVWTGVAKQDTLASVSAVYNDCRPLQ